MSQRQQPGKVATERLAEHFVLCRTLARQFLRLVRHSRAESRLPRPHWATLFAAPLVCVTRPGHADGGSRWRIYPVTAGPSGSFAVAVTVSPRGNVWVRQGG